MPRRLHLDSSSGQMSSGVFLNRDLKRSFTLDKQ